MREPIVVPDLGPVAATFSLWLAMRGDRLYKGDRVAEVLVGAATCELTAPVDGLLAETLAQPGDLLTTGQVIGALHAGGRDRS